MATTVKNLIKQLQEIENQDQTVVFEYYIAEHFIDPKSEGTMTPERFEKIVDNALDYDDYLWDDVYKEIKNVIDEYEDEEDEE